MSDKLLHSVAVFWMWVQHTVNIMTALCENVRASQEEIQPETFL